MQYEKKFYTQQRTIIYKLKQYLNKLETNSINSALSGLTYFYSNGYEPGFVVVKFIISFKAGLLETKHYIKECFSHLKKKPHLTIKKNQIKKKYKKLILTWAYKKQFNNDGSLNDKYFNLDSKTDPDLLWFVITDDLNFKVQSNIILIKENKYKNYNFINFFKQFFKTLYDSKFSFKKFLHYFPYNSFFAKNISRELLSVLKDNNIKKISLPYEPQPFQQYLIQNAKKMSNKIYIEGYLHSVLPSFPTEYIFRESSPDRLLVHGQGQIDILKKDLYWPNKKLKLTKSKRYKKLNKKLDKNYVYLPYNINQPDKLSKTFDQFLEKEKDGSLNKVSIKSHPVKKNDKKSLLFENQIRSILLKNKKKFSSKKNKSKLNFCFGTSSAIIELLENKKTVIQITSDPLFELFNSKMWRYISLKKIDENIFSYKLKQYGKYIKY